MPHDNHCAVAGCAAKAKAGQLMCLPHWKALPRHLQKDVNATWKRYRYEPQAYLEAKRAAVAYFRDRGPEQDLLL